MERYSQGVVGVGGTVQSRSGGSGWKGTVKEWVTTAGAVWEWLKGYSQGVGDYSRCGVGVGGRVQSRSG